MSEIAITQSANPAGENVPHPPAENPPATDQFAGDLIESLVSTVEKAEAAHGPE